MRIDTEISAFVKPKKVGHYGVPVWIPVERLQKNRHLVRFTPCNLSCSGLTDEPPPSLLIRRNEEVVNPQWTSKEITHWSSPGLPWVITPTIVVFFPRSTWSHSPRFTFEENGETLDKMKNAFIQVFGWCFGWKQLGIPHIGEYVDMLTVHMWKDYLMRKKREFAKCEK